MTPLDYLAHRRIVILIDEWGYYGAIAGLYFLNEHVLFSLVLVYGAVCMMVSYRAYWRLERNIIGRP